MMLGSRIAIVEECLVGFNLFSGGLELGLEVSGCLVLRYHKFSPWVDHRLNSLCRRTLADRRLTHTLPHLMNGRRITYWDLQAHVEKRIFRRLLLGIVDKSRGLVLLES